jgi:glycosyltransferase involved in cell wall biosynthesis
MIIGFDGSRAFVKNKTGTENYSYQLLKHLSKIDKENTYFVYLRQGSGVRSRDFPPNFRLIEINFLRLWTQAGLSLQTFQDKLDLLFVPAHTTPLIRRPGLKTVMVVHDLGAEYLPGTHQLKQRLYLKVMTKYQLKTATKIIAVSESTKKDLINKVGIRSENIKVIYEGLDSNQYVSPKSDILTDILNKYVLKKGKYFLFVGTIQPRKNLGRLIEAYGKFLSLSRPETGDDLRFTKNDSREKNHKSLIISHESQPKLVLAGSKGWLSDEIYDLPKNHGIEDKVKFLGHVPDEDMAGLYSGALAFVFPSLFEGFGLPILEAMACGVPVITSNTSSMPEVAGNAALLIDPESVEDIKNSMKKIAENSAFREDLIKKGLKQVQKFSWEKCAAETLDLLLEVGGRKK